MTLDNAHPIDEYDEETYGENIDANQAKKLVTKGYEPHAFICNAKNKDGDGFCKASIMLAAPFSKKVKPYFKTLRDQTHTCDIQKKLISRNGKTQASISEYKAEETVYKFFQNALDSESQLKSNHSEASPTNHSSSKKAVRQHGSTESRNVKARRKSINTLQSVVANRKTTQYLDTGIQIKVDDLFHELKYSKSKFQLPDPRLILIWYCKVQIYKTSISYANIIKYRLYFVGQKIDGRQISSLLTENEMKELLPGFNKYLSYGDANDPNKKRCSLDFYTTESPKTSKDGRFENIIIEPTWHHLSSRMYIVPPAKLK